MNKIGRKMMKKHRSRVEKKRSMRAADIAKAEEEKNKRKRKRNKQTIL